MATTVVMPKLGLTMTEGKIVRWLKQEGDPVALGDKLFEVETEKLNLEVEAQAPGILRRILALQGAVLPVSTAVAIIGAADEELPDLPAPVSATPARVVQPSAASAVPGATPSIATSGATAPITPAARKLAVSHGLNLAALRGTGPNGRVTLQDVEAAIAALAQGGTEDGDAVTFFSDGYRLVGRYFGPAGMADGLKAPGIVLCSSILGIKEATMLDLARAIGRDGFAILAFDYHGFGQSEGPRHRLVPLEQVADVRAALTWLAQQPGVDSDSLGLVGVSFGGGHALVAAALDRRVKAVVAISPMTNGERWLRSLRREWEWRAFEQQLAADRQTRVVTGMSAVVSLYDVMVPDPEAATLFEMLGKASPQLDFEPQITLECADQILDYRPEDWADRLVGRSILFIHGSEDVLVAPDESAQAVDRLSGNPGVELVAGMGHFNWQRPGSPLFTNVCTKIVSWLNDLRTVG